MEIRKAAGVLEAGMPNPRQLEEINKHTKSPLTAEDVYVFAVRLCDDRPDRDNERFSKEAIHRLAPMFVGKTGILDHDWSSDRQLGRIFATEVLTDGDATWLKAWVYMLRSEKTEGIIREIEGGIKKEVSIGCAVGRTVCSVCGADYGACDHRKGHRYGTEVCCAVLEDPVDAYEFSFVAVPAQKEAGVVKAAGKEDARMAALEKEAEYGRLYRKKLCSDVVRLGLMLDTGAEASVLHKMVAALEVEELIALQDAFSQKAAKQFPATTQLSAPAQGKTEKTDSAFLI